MRGNLWLACLGIVLLASVPVLGEELRRGRTIEPFTLADHWGKQHKLVDLADKRVVVVAFLGTECPLAKLYASRLNELVAEFSPQGVAFLAIDSNQQDSLEEIAAFVRTHDLKLPMLKDVGNVVADQFGANRTPDVFVLDRSRSVQYVGRIDDQYGYQAGVGFQKPAPSRRDLAEAVTELLADHAVSVPVTEAPGCLIGRARQAQDASSVTYSNQIARIMQNRCVTCHRPGEVAPFSLESYEQVSGWGEMIREVVDNGRMPPWGASPEFHFLNDPRLSDEEKSQIRQWVDAGCPQGDEADLPEPRQWVEGWNIEQPDLVIKMAEQPFEVPATGEVPYQYFEVDPGFTEDVWIKASEARPGNRAVVHHIIVFVQPPGRAKGVGFGAAGPQDLLAGYAPGSMPQQSDRGMARKVEAGSKLLFQLHYTPNGTAQSDISYLGLKFATPEEVKHDVRSGFAMNVNLRIPPGANNYETTARRKFTRDTWLLSMMPHMHLRGKSFKYEVIYPDGRRETLLDVPRYDFNWQLSYVYEEPKLLPKGTTLFCTAHFDNSAENLANPDPSQEVRWGDQTWEEMMIGWVVTADPKPIEVTAKSTDPAAGGE